MKKIILTTSILIICLVNNAQNISGFTSTLNNYKSNYRNSLYNEKDEDDLKSALSYIGSGVSNLIDDIEDFEVNGNDQEIMKKKKDILLEAKEFKSFASTQLTECLYYFNKFLSEMGCSGTLVTEKQGVRICKANLGNFIFFYAYALNNDKILTVTLNLSSYENGMQMSKKSASVGLGTEVETLIILHKTQKEKYTSSSVKFENMLDPTFRSNPCKETFPRK